MAQRNRHTGRPTALTVAAVRADLVHSQPPRYPELVATVEDIYALPGIATWGRHNVDRAADQLVAEGRITEAADGRLCVHARRDREGS